MDQIDKNFVADVLLLLVLLVVVAGGFAVFHTSGLLVGGGLALTIAVLAEYVWSRRP